MLYINGSLRDGSGKSFDSVNPYTNTVLASIKSASQQDINEAVEIAAKAQKEWARVPLRERSRVLSKAVAILRARNAELAMLETRDTGKPISETSTVDITTGTDVLEYYAKHQISGSAQELRPDAWFYTKKEPLGVVAQIGAWNYPIQIALWKSAPALIAGNSVVFKPSEKTPLSVLELAQIYSEAGVPKGVFNVVQGLGDVGAALIQHQKIAKVSFTGSVDTGKRVYASAAKDMKYSTMELGGKSPLIVLPDANLEKAVNTIVEVGFFSSGQVCTAPSRIFIHESILPRLEKEIIKKCEAYLVAGSTENSQTNLGPVIDRSHADKVRQFIATGHKEGGENILAHLKSKIEKQIGKASLEQSGCWIMPTIFKNLSPQSTLATTEIFGPVMTLHPFGSISDLIEVCNSLPYALAAGCFSSNIDTCRELSNSIDAGIFWINSWGESPEEMPVGGWKASGVGVENGMEGVEAYLRNKSVFIEKSKL